MAGGIVDEKHREADRLAHDPAALHQVTQAAAMPRSRDLRLGGFGEWHPGEVALQGIAGSEKQLAPHASRILLPVMTDQLRRFFPSLPFIVVSFVDDQDRPWGTILPGPPGFVWSPTPDTLRIKRAPPAGDPLAAALSVQASVGLLGIELPTRRRNRVNGFVSACDPTGFTVTIQQAFGNCPQYIQQRTYTALNAPSTHLEVSAFANLDDEEARALLGEADTMFVASFASGPDGRPAMDISHRGGKPGFIRVDEDSCLTIPDFSGNRFFNTLGNILLTGMACLVVPCFASGDVLLLTGDAQVGLGGDRHVAAGPVGTERLWQIRPRQGRWLRGALPVELQLKSWSSQTLATGSWTGAELPVSPKGLPGL